jgi:hypothetical protein
MIVIADPSRATRLPCLSAIILGAIILVFVALAGCAMLPAPTLSPQMDQPGLAGSCAAFFAELDRQVQKAGVLDPGAFRVEKYPYLRVNRFLASFNGDIRDETAFNAWADRLQALDQEGRRHEIANLPDRIVIAGERIGAPEAIQQVVTCGDVLRSADFAAEQARADLQESISAPDDYLTLRRVIGLYPITKPFIYWGVLNWHEGVHRRFTVQPPADWQSVIYVPPDRPGRKDAGEIVTQAKRDALGIPLFTSAEQEALLQFHAPVWEVESARDFNLIGTPYWAAQGRLAVDTQKPTVYTLISFTRFGSEILTQLNYITWFTARPKQSALDIYGGPLDGVNFRVTLDAAGAPLLYESVHNCGCYYKAYPTRRLQVREKIAYPEPPLILQAPEYDPGSQFITVAMESRTHYVQHLYTTDRRRPSDAVSYRLQDYGYLLSMAHPAGARSSMFDQYGIAHGSHRLERYILWPTGVLSPGAMRQYGRHAVAFIGRRHFDDPHYLQEIFDRK